MKVRTVIAYKRYFITLLKSLSEKMQYKVVKCDTGFLFTVFPESFKMK